MPPLAARKVGLGAVAAGTDTERSRIGRKWRPHCHIPQPPAEPAAVKADRFR